MKSHRFFWLDVLQGVAILGILFSLMPNADHWETNTILFPLYVLHRTGWTFIEFFLVLSGFLIVRMLVTDLQNAPNVSQFLGRLALRLLPSYLVVYLGGVALECCEHFRELEYSEIPETLHDIPYNLLLVQNFFPHYAWRHSWNLALGFQMGIVLPLVVFVLWKIRKWNWFGPLVLFGGLVALGARVLVLSFQGNLAHDVYHQTQYRFDATLFGGWLGFLMIQNPVVFRNLHLLAGRLLFLIILVIGSIGWNNHHDLFSYGPGLTVLYVCFGMILIVAVSTDETSGATGSAIVSSNRSVPLAPPVSSLEESGGLRPPFASADGDRVRTFCRPLAWLGTHSYTIFLSLLFVHQFLYFHDFEVLREIVARFSGDIEDFNETAPHTYLHVRELMFFVSSICGGFLVSYLIERPCLALRERWLPGRLSSCG